ncbi:hypothetical protein O3P69_003846 [Scylla paramamosain]|uniref:Uncharacterized protein n=1 Tax=Scylla paramamosain TaxID=85552 RepID=A0AAW0UDL3_SCYPA
MLCLVVSSLLSLGLMLLDGLLSRKIEVSPQGSKCQVWGLVGRAVSLAYPSRSPAPLAVSRRAVTQAELVLVAAECPWYINVSVQSQRPLLAALADKHSSTATPPTWGTPAAHSSSIDVPPISLPIPILLPSHLVTAAPDSDFVDVLAEKVSHSPQICVTCVASLAGLLIVASTAWCRIFCLTLPRRQKEKNLPAPPSRRAPPRPLVDLLRFAIYSYNVRSFLPISARPPEL